MSRLAHTTAENKTPLHHRIMANLTVQASWVDAESGNTVSVNGFTENLGETSALVNLETFCRRSEVKLNCGFLMKKKRLLKFRRKLSESNAIRANRWPRFRFWKI